MDSNYTDPKGTEPLSIDSLTGDLINKIQTLGGVISHLIDLKILTDSTYYLALGIARLERAHRHITKQSKLNQLQTEAKYQKPIGTSSSPDTDPIYLSAGSDQLYFGHDDYKTLENLPTYEPEALVSLLAALAHSAYKMGHTRLPLNKDDLNQIFHYDSLIARRERDASDLIRDQKSRNVAESVQPNRSFLTSDDHVIEEQTALIKLTMDYLINKLMLSQDLIENACGGVMENISRIDFNQKRTPLIFGIDSSSPWIALDQAWAKETEIHSNLTNLLDSVSLPILPQYPQSSSQLIRFLKARFDVITHETYQEQGTQSYFVLPENPKEYMFTALQRHRTAALAALSNRVTFIHGGPGTGKTTLAQKILALLLEIDDLFRSFDSKLPALRVAIVAPTGKAAIRVKQSIYNGILDDSSSLNSQLSYPLNQVTQKRLSDLKIDGITIHRLLKYHPDRPTYSRYTPESPLPYDVVIIDESSMLDLTLIRLLLRAIPQKYGSHPIQRLIFLGDPDQLPPVGEGAFWRDICRICKKGVAQTAKYNRTWQPNMEFQVIIDQICPNLELPVTHYNRIYEASAELEGSFRISSDQGASQILDFASLIREGKDSEAIALLESATSQRSTDLNNQSGIEWIRLVHYNTAKEANKDFKKDDGNPCIIPRDQERYKTWLHDKKNHVAQLRESITNLQANSTNLTEEFLQLEDDFQKELILCAHYKGSFGVDYYNEHLQKSSKNHPILVLINYAKQRLFNGDIGFISSNQDGFAVFKGMSEEQPVRVIPLHNLPHHDTVYSMSIHKSQGSEFEKVVIVLPPYPSRLLTRELLYTAVTRAQKKVLVISSETALKEAIRDQVHRYTGQSYKEIKNA
jgi:exodeoxyribonuclease V alpha subunit